jgi:hypothetical protein
MALRQTASVWPSASQHTLVDLHLAVIAHQHGIEVKDDLAQILPPDGSAENDPSIIPGLEDPH